MADIPEDFEIGKPQYCGALFADQSFSPIVTVGAPGFVSRGYAGRLEQDQSMEFKLERQGTQQFLPRGSGVPGGPRRSR